jgi:hypothetical protein
VGRENQGISRRGNLLAQLFSFKRLFVPSTWGRRVNMPPDIYTWFAENFGVFDMLLLVSMPVVIFIALLLQERH